MKRTAAAFMLIAGLGGGCMTTEHKAELARTAKHPAPVPTQTVRAANYVGPHGEPVTARGQAPGGIVRADGRNLPPGGIMPVGGDGGLGYTDILPGDVAKGGPVPLGADGV